ncbi:ABC-2 family transporter protein [Clostridium gasigenes]|uniref:ABC transporter permease n=1 Tax=Clostridium gasigenes TaxID=94869 RepID=UPI001C0DABBA|nr:ABC-2 family transporter protein [Clostridium gasigenes]MBU3135442.1 ABC-2 family transporter protein [Clostridium gasigenes]
MKYLKNLKPYLPFATNTFQRLISYKANVLIFIFGESLMLAVTYYLWKAIYGSTEGASIHGFSFNEMIIYVFISFLTSLIIAVDISYDIAREVKDGSIAINLIRPISYEKRMFFQSLGTVFYYFIFIFIGTFAVTTAMFYNFFGYVNIANILLYLFSITLGILLNFYFSYIFGLLSFKITNMWGLTQITQAIVQLLSGIMIPIAFFPVWAQPIFKFLPFSSMVYTPTMIYLGKLNNTEILKALLIQVIWIVILMTIAKIMWKKLIKTLTILGG